MMRKSSFQKRRLLHCDGSDLQILLTLLAMVQVLHQWVAFADHIRRC